MTTTIPWLQILSDSLDGEYPARVRVCSLATVSPDHRPAVRTVILRRLDEQGRLAFATDARSHKLDHLRANPAVEICFWLPGWREQYRLAGPAELLGPDTPSPLRQQIWTGLSDVNRAMYFWPAPSAPVSHDEPSVHAMDARTPAPSNFLVLTLSPGTVEQLELNFEPHRRRVWRRDTNWREERINP